MARRHRVHLLRINSSGGGIVTAATISPAALAPKDAAAYIGCSVDTLAEYVKQGRIVPRFHGAKATRPVFKVTDLDALLDSLPEESGRTR